MNLVFNNYIYEATLDINSIEDSDVALMTLGEYVNHRNPERRIHKDSAYDLNIKTMNSSVLNYIHQYINEEFKIKQYDKDFADIYKDNVLVAIVKNGTLYREKLIDYKLPIWYRNVLRSGIEEEDVNFKLEYSETKIVKNINEFHENFKKPYLLSVKLKYENLLQQTKFKGKSFELRSDSSKNLALFNSDNYIVAVAQDEWGSTLVIVAEEYRGFGLGEFILNKWYELNPNYESGGYTSKGYELDTNYWANRVISFMSSGVYSELLKKHKIDKSKLNEIITTAKELTKLKTKTILGNYEFKETLDNILVYSDNTQIILYDEKYLDTLDKKYIYGFALLRDLDSIGYFFYKLEYYPKYKKIMNTLALQLAYDNKHKLYIGPGYSDYMELDVVNGVKVEGNYCWIDKNIINLQELLRYEKYLRSKVKNPDLLNTLIEEANYKKYQ